MKNFVLNCIFNNLSLGQIGTAISREFYNKGLFPYIAPINGQIQLDCQKPLKLFESWVHSNYHNYIHKYEKTDDSKSLRVWHLNGSKESVISNDGYLLTFHETDSLTQAEVSTCNCYKKVFVTSNYSKKVFEDFGVKNVEYIELGFDKVNFWKTNKVYYSGENKPQIVWGLFGKLEHRKHHLRTLRAWCERFGNSREHVLHMATYNPFMSPEDQTKMILSALNGQKYWNINFLPHVKTNVEYNDIINSCDIVLGTSGGEAFDIPLFSSIALGKHAIVLNAHAHKDYCNDENSILIPHSGKIRAADNIFFSSDPNTPYNTGNFFNFDDNILKESFDIAVERFRLDPVNKAGLELQNKTYSKTLDQIFKIIGV